MHVAESLTAVTRPAFLTSPEAAKYLGVSRHTLEAWRQRKCGPRFTLMVGKVIYHLADLDAFLGLDTPQTGNVVGTGAEIHGK